MSIPPLETDSKQSHAIAIPTPDSPPDDAVNTRVALPAWSPDGVRQLDVVLDHPDSGRQVVQTFALDCGEGQMFEKWVGYEHGRLKFAVEREHAEHRFDATVRVPSLDEDMALGEYARLVGFDEPGWKVGAGFDEFCRTHGT